MRTVPNLLSVFRICLVPIFIAAYFRDQRDTKFYAVLIYAVAALSDFLDGFLARKLKATSKLGKVLDPLADKLMTISAMACITIDGIIPIWAVLVAGVKEILMAIGGFIMYKKAGADILPSNILGKTSTVLFFLVCVTLMLRSDIPGAAATAMISTALGLMLLALAAYLRMYIIIMKNRGKQVTEKEGNV